MIGVNKFVSILKSLDMAESNLENAKSLCGTGDLILHEKITAIYEDILMLQNYLSCRSVIIMDHPEEKG